MRNLTDIKKIIIHCSDSEFGDLDLIDKWHKERGWSKCGYHCVITNGIIQPGKSYNSDLDGLVQEGRPLDQIGAHCKGYNKDSIGICLIGKHHFTGKQLYGALPDLIFKLKVLGIYASNIYGHCEFSGKTCPNIDPALIRKIAQ